MSIDVYNYPIKPQSLDPRSHRTSLQKGGFADMMDVLHQNEMMNQFDNAQAPIEEEPFVVSKEPIESNVEEAPKASQETLPKEVQAVVEPEKEAPVIAEVAAPQPILTQKITPDVITVLPIEAPTEVVASNVENQPILDVEIVNDIESTPIVQSKEPVALFSPIPEAQSSATVIEVANLQDIPEVLEQLLPEILAAPEVQEQIQANTTPERNLPTVQPELTQQVAWQVRPQVEIEKSDLQTKEKSTQPILDPYRVSQQPIEVDGIEFEEDSKVQFVRYVEEEIRKPNFQDHKMERTDIPDIEPFQQQDQSNPNAIAQGANVVTDKVVGVVNSKADAVQATTIPEKSSAKEELKLPKQKVQQSFAQLLKQAKETAESFEPTFHSNLLKKLEIQVRDPAGVIQLEIAQNEAVIHVKAVVPVEAMSDLHYLGQDIHGSLEDMGLQLGSYELRSHEDEQDEFGFGDTKESSFDDIEDAEEVQSNYTVDKRI